MLFKFLKIYCFYHFFIYLFLNLTCQGTYLFLG